MIQNRRRTTRSKVTVVAELHGAGERRERSMTSLSMEGAFFEGESAETGVILDLAMGLDDDMPAMRARGVVVRQTERGAAVRFVGLSTRDRVRLVEQIFAEE